MGTSSINRSPQTTRWRVVSAIYDSPQIDASLLLDQVLNASAAVYVEGLADAAVLARLEQARDVLAHRFAGDRDAALAAARAAVTAARESSLTVGGSSFFGALADRALNATFVRAASNPESVGSPGSATVEFLSQLIGSAVDHLVSRDLTAHVGSPSLRSIADIAALRQDLTERARRGAAHGQGAELLRSAVNARDVWPRAVTTAWTEAQRARDEQVNN